MTTASKISFPPKGCVCLLTLAFFLDIAAAAAQPSPADVGLVTKLSGEATYFNRTDQPQPARVQLFMKVRQGDYFKLPPHSLVNLVYLDSGRQETWRGPVTIITGLGESRVKGDKGRLPQPEVQVLPTKVTKRMVAAGMPLPRSSISYSGVIQTMTPRDSPAVPQTSLSPEAQQQIVTAEEIYRDLQKEAKPGDFTPELYLLSVYAEYGQYAKIEKVIDFMCEQQPTNTTLKELKEWVRSQSASPN